MHSSPSSLSLLLALVLCGASACKPEAQATYPERRGGRGESCVVTNDCKSPLLCLGGRCLDGESALTASSKVCAVGECISASDCCKPRSKAQLERCDELEQECASLGTDSFACESFAQTCGPCTATCQDHLCVVESSSESECASNDECFGGLCAAGRCVECTKDSECGESGFVCEQGTCFLGCRRTEECGALEACNKGRCEKRACEGDRECIVMLNAREAACQAGECVISCEGDEQCVARLGGLGGLLGLGGSALSVCIDGACRSPGCETNAECQSRVDTLGDELALCLSPEEADKVRAGRF